MTGVQTCALPISDIVAKIILPGSMPGILAGFRISASVALLLLNVGGAKHTRQSMVDRLTDAGLVIGEIRPVNPYLHAFECTTPA